MLRDPSPPMETPISVRREARNTGFVVYMSFTMEPPPTLRPSSFTVNWKSNPLTNSWTEEGESVQPRDNDITVISVNDFVVANPLSFGGGKKFQSFFTTGQRHPRIHRGFLDVFRFENSFRGRKTKRRKGENIERTWLY